MIIKKHILFSVSLFLILSVFSVSPFVNASNPQPPNCTQCPNGILYYLPITLGNTKSIPTSNNLPYPITFNSTKYSSYLANNLQNIIFVDNTGYALYAWCESNCINTATSTLFYVNLGTDTIPAHGQIIVWMGIYATNFDDRSASGFYGQNPTISGITKDNGAKVFTFYDDFAGTTLNSIWTVTSNGAPQLGTYTVNNGITLTSSSTSSAIEIHTSSTFTYQDNNHVNYTFEWYSAPFTQNAPSDSEFQLGWYSSNSNSLYVGTSNSIRLQYATSATTGSSTTATAISDSTGKHLFGVYANGQSVVGTFDYNIIGTGTTSYIPPSPHIGAGFNYETSLTTPILYFVRDRMIWTGTSILFGSLTLPPISIPCNQSSMILLDLAIVLATLFFILMIDKKAKHEGITTNTIIWVFYLGIIVIILIIANIIGLTASSQICPASG